MSYHSPVLLQECLDALNIKKDGLYVDATFGGGGHSKAILDLLSSSGRLIAFDRDQEAIANRISDERLVLAHHDYRFLKRFARYYGFDKVDGILADLGISSHQIDAAERGFSTRFKESKLDMRMDQDAALSAYEVLNNYDSSRLNKLFKSYGELKNTNAIVKRLLNFRSIKPIEFAKDVFKALDGMTPKSKENQFYAQVFQAVRIEVNQELDSLKLFLEQCEKILKPNGRLVVMSYHSLEDRIVKRFIKNGFNTAHTVLPELQKKWSLKALNTKPIIPCDKEIQLNSRARSAKLRIAEKIEDES